MSEGPRKDPVLAAIFGVVAGYAAYKGVALASAGESLNAASNLLIATGFGIDGVQRVKSLSGSFNKAKLGAYTAGFGTATLVLGAANQPLWAMIYAGVTAVSAYALQKSFKPQ